MRKLYISILVISTLVLFLSCETPIPTVKQVIPVLAPIPARPELVVINEVASAGDYEFVELFNLSPAPLIFSSGWVISDNGKGYEDGDTPFVIPEGVSIDAYGYLVICPFSEEDSKSVLNDSDLPPEALCDISFSIGSEDSVTLYYDNTVVDALSWNSDVNSYGRVSDGLPELSNMLNATPGSANKAESTTDEYSIRINEICSKGDDYVEIINIGELRYLFEPNSWYIEDVRKKRDIKIESGFKLKPGEVYVIYTGEAADPLKLGSSDTVILRHKDEVVDWYSWSEHVQSIGRDPDDTDLWVVMGKTPGEVNQLGPITE